MINQYFVYLVTNYTKTVLYVGVTNNLERRLMEHKNNLFLNAFTVKYKCHYLVWFEEYDQIEKAIAREKQIKNWTRDWKNELIKVNNPNWIDLAKDW